MLLILSILQTTPVGAGEMINLPPPSVEGTVSVERALLKRRSVRHFKDQGLTPLQLSQLFWAGEGITEPSTGFRTAPSAGATYPLELYGLSKDGLFHYLPKEHKLKLISGKDTRKDIAIAAYGQFYIAGAPLNIVITAVPARTERRYGKMAERYINMEVGHVAQNILLEAVALGLGGVPIGAFSESGVKNILGLPKGEEPLYIISIGYPRHE